MRSFLGMQAVWDRARVRPVTPLLSELQTCRGKCATALEITSGGRVLQAVCPAGHDECLCYGVAGGVLGCSVQFTWVAPSSLGPEASADRDTALSSGA